MVDNRLVDTDDADGVAIVARMGLAGLAAIAAAGDPTLGVLAAAALPAADAAVTRVQTWRRAALAYTLQTAADAADTDPEQLVELLVADRAKLRLLTHSLETAQETAWERKLRTLGRALASGALADDDALVEEETHWTLILRRIEAPHLRIIEFLCREDPEYPGKGYLNAGKRTDLQRVSGFRELIGPTLAEMESNGLVHATDGAEYDTHFRARWGLTAGLDRTAYVRGELARPCLERFKLAGGATSDA
jgi:hypothetical protein